MEKYTKSLIIISVFTLIAVFARADLKTRMFPGNVIRVIDGDSIEVSLDLGLDISKLENIRLYGVNTPELNSKDPGERKEALIAKRFVNKRIEGKNVLVSIISKNTKQKKGKYGRYLAIVYYGKNLDKNLNKELISNGLAKEYFGGKR